MRATLPCQQAMNGLVGSYSITSSARTSKLAGTSRPSALAVLRLRTSSNLVGCCTGRSSGFSPCRIRSRCAASPVTATTDFLAPDFLNKCGLAVPAVSHAPRGTRKPMKGVAGCFRQSSRQPAHPFEVGEAPPDHFLLAHVFTLAGAISMGTMEIGAAPVAWADEIALGRGLLREVGATAPPRDIGQEAALGQPIPVYLDLLLTQPLGISLKAAFDLRFGLADPALDVIRLLVFPLGEVLLDDLHRALAIVGKILAVGLVGHVVVGPVVEGIGIVLHHHRVGVDAVGLADADDLAVEGHLIVGLGHVVFSLLYWRGIAADVTAYTKRKAACIATSGPSL